MGHDLEIINREAGHLARAHVYGDVFRVRSFVSYCATVHFEHEVNNILHTELNCCVLTLILLTWRIW
jgi:hypothetical protein